MNFSVMKRYLPALLLLAPVAAQAKPKWKTVYSNSDVKVTMDTASVALNADGSYSVWTQWDYSKARVLENKKSYTRLVEKADLKCSPIVMKRVNTSLYDKNGTVLKAPEELGASEVAAMSWDPPKRGTDGASVWASVCRTIKAKKK